VNRHALLEGNTDGVIGTGYVYARTLYHIAFPVGKIGGVDTELQILGNLLGQTRWLLGKRGWLCWGSFIHPPSSDHLCDRGCYDRIACIYMKDLKNRTNVEKAHDIVTCALTDNETRFRAHLIHPLVYAP
jgi:hypothetical protein